MIETVTIKLEHQGKEHVFKVRKGLGLQALARQTSILEFDCREADCGICICKVKDGAEHLTPPTRAEADFLRAMHADADERLACQCRVFGDVKLEVENYAD